MEFGVGMDPLLTAEKASGAPQGFPLAGWISTKQTNKQTQTVSGFASERSTNPFEIGYIQSSTFSTLI